MRFVKLYFVIVLLGCSSTTLWSQINPQVENLLNVFYTLKYAYDNKDITLTENMYNSSYDGLCFEAHITFSLVDQSWETSNAAGHHQVLRRVRQTLDELSQNAETIHKWETHTGEHDTINYAMFLKPGTATTDYQNHMIYDGDKHWASGGLESVNMEYTAMHPSKEELTQPTRLARGTLTYKCVLDTLAKATKDFNATAYCDAIKTIVNQKGISMRKVHYKQDAGDTYGIHYIIRSQENALNVLDQLRKTTKEYIASHPNESFNMFNPRQNDYISTYPFLSGNTNPSPVSQEVFSVFTIFSKDYYHILVLYTDGVLDIPTDWEIIKEYDHGKVEYYDKDIKFMNKTGG
ncbi:MAG: hypothetical protein J5770_06275 [Bacteroidaceae bacterium]|nr:hypothetical protein [Bacteroidaceae bacterium]